MNELTVKELFKNQEVERRFEKLLGNKSQGFISSVLQVVGANKLLSKADPQSVLQAAATAATLDLPINQNLGFAWIVPYKGKAQFQMGWRGFVQLALRTSQYHKMNVIEVYANQFKSFDGMTETLDADFSIEGKGEVAGYVAYFKLINGFEKTVYWSKSKVSAHAKKYSKSFGSGSSPWNDEFDAMARKTVLKNTISQYGIMSIEMQTAITVDQAVVDQDGVKYADNPRIIDVEAENVEAESKRIVDAIEKATTKDSLQDIEDTLIAEDLFTDEYQTMINNKRKAL